MKIFTNRNINEILTAHFVGKVVDVARWSIMVMLVLMPLHAPLASDIMGLFFTPKQKQQVALIKQMRNELLHNPHLEPPNNSDLQKNTADWVKLGGIAKTAHGYRVWINGRFWREHQELEGLRVTEVTPKSVTLVVIPTDSTGRMNGRIESNMRKVLVRPGEFVNLRTGEVHRAIKPPTASVAKSKTRSIDSNAIPNRQSIESTQATMR